jgi:SAM-dependent methyltransferase
VTWATEGYPPNIEVARRRLEPLGVRVAAVGEDASGLPFDDQTFDLVIDRHEGYRAREMYRVLKPGGRLITQQVGGENCMGINRALQEIPAAPYQFWTLAYELDRLKEVGFAVEEAREAFPSLAFYDIGALVFYLKIVIWQVEDFTVERYQDKLYQIHESIKRDGAFVVSEHRTLIRAVRIA